MQIKSRQATTYLIGAQVAALMVGYMLRSPELTEKAERKAHIRSQAKEEAFEQQEALQRAQTCLPLLSEMPITDGTAAYFSSLENGQIVIHPHRPMPSGTIVCDAFGNTGIVSFDSLGNPVVGSIRSLPFEQMEKILQDRGVMPRPTQHNIVNSKPKP